MRGGQYIAHSALLRGEKAKVSYSNPRYNCLKFAPPPSQPLYRQSFITRMYILRGMPTFLRHGHIWHTTAATTSSAQEYSMELYGIRRICVKKSIIVCVTSPKECHGFVSVCSGGLRQDSFRVLKFNPTGHMIEFAYYDQTHVRKSMRYGGLVTFVYTQSKR